MVAIIVSLALVALAVETERRFALQARLTEGSIPERTAHD